MYFALVPNTVTPRSSIVSHMDSALFNGDPSYITTVAPVAKADTRYWNIIHPLSISCMIHSLVGGLRGGIVKVDVASSDITCDMALSQRIYQHSPLAMLNVSVHPLICWRRTHHDGLWLAGCPTRKQDPYWLIKSHSRKLDITLFLVEMIIPVYYLGPKLSWAWYQRIRKMGNDNDLFRLVFQLFQQDRQ